MSQHERFNVQSAADFLSASDVRADAITAKAERAARNARLAEQQRQINDYQNTRSRMSARNVLEDELAMFREMTQNSVENFARCEAVFDALQKGDR